MSCCRARGFRQWVKTTTQCLTAVGPSSSLMRTRDVSCSGVNLTRGMMIRMAASLCGANAAKRLSSSATSSPDLCVSTSRPMRVCKPKRIDDLAWRFLYIKSRYETAFVTER
eukprot:scaffold10796_cov114-Isochrysis_galbana.AAC.8